MTSGGSSTIGDRPALDAATIRRMVIDPGATIWQRILVRETTTSTNAELADLARAGDPEGTVLVTDHQVAGRGRLGRSWQTPPRSSLAVSVLLRPVTDPVAWPWLSLLAGLAVTDVLEQVCGVSSRLKWPNDVLLAGPSEQDPERKVCGILAEVVHGPQGAPGVVLGTGINVSQGTEELPVAGATSLRLAGARSLDRVRILAAYLHRLSEYYQQWFEAGGDVSATGLADRYRSRCATVGSPVRVHLPDTSVDGVAEQVDERGGLVVRDGAGRIHRLAAGDVVHVRPATG